MPKMRINCGPRGIIMTKSTATVNWTAASISSRSHSLNGRRSESICGRGSAALNRAGEECAGVVKTPTFDADQLIVKSAAVVVLPDGADAKGWYVSLSRAREKMHVYTCNKAALRQSVMQPVE